jgi:hypothetical protein
VERAQTHLGQFVEFLWHFVEEIEHRSSALLVYDAVHDSFLYRRCAIPGVVKHMGEILANIWWGFRHVPERDGGDVARLMPKGLSYRAIRESVAVARKVNKTRHSTYSGVPRREVAAMLAGLVRSQGPTHDPWRERLPTFAARWLATHNDNPHVVARWYSGGDAGNE